MKEHEFAREFEVHHNKKHSLSMRIIVEQESYYTNYYYSLDDVCTCLKIEQSAMRKRYEQYCSLGVVRRVELGGESYIDGLLMFGAFMMTNQRISKVVKSWLEGINRYKGA